MTIDEFLCLGCARPRSGAFDSGHVWCMTDADLDEYCAHWLNVYETESRKRRELPPDADLLSPDEIKKWQVNSAFRAWKISVHYVSPGERERKERRDFWAGKFPESWFAVLAEPDDAATDETE